MDTDEGKNTLREFRELPRIGTADFEFASIREIRVTPSFSRIRVHLCPSAVKQLASL